MPEDRPVTGARPRPPRGRGGARRLRGTKRTPAGPARIAGRRLGVVGLLVVTALIGYVGWQYTNLSTGLVRSTVLGAAAAPRGAQNILLMGLDSRLDENGNPLPAAVYRALHTGGADIGGANANVLILLHIPTGGARATAISIPRDDYVHLVGCPDGECTGKIKQAYGLALDQEAKVLVHEQHAPTGVRREQTLRDAGRRAEIQTVQQFLGGVPVTHFVEVTMVGFYQLAQVVAPITVCLAENTKDSYSGADFHRGRQRLDAAQALAFVRQRRDTTGSGLDFTDLDRERRQQAFIVSLASQFKQAGTFTDPATLSRLIGVATKNAAVDTGLNLFSFARQAQSLAAGHITYYTLPIGHFGTDRLGEDVNVVNLPLIHATVHHLLTDPTSAHPSGKPTRTATTSTSTAATFGAPAPATAVPATGNGALAPTALTALSGGGIPCVK